MARKRSSVSVRRTATTAKKGNRKAARKTVARKTGVKKTSPRATGTVKKTPTPGARRLRQRRIAALTAATAGSAVETLQQQVLDLLRRASPFPPTVIEPCQDLRRELGLTDDLKRALSTSLQAIARAIKAGVRISDDECSALGKVEDVTALAATKAGLDFKKVCE